MWRNNTASKAWCACRPTSSTPGPGAWTTPSSASAPWSPWPSCKLEFLEPVTEGGYHWDYIQAGGRGINHICFKVHDFDHWQEHFRALGHNLFFGYEDEDQENGYRRCLYARDPVLDMVYEIKEINRYRDANGVLEEGKG